MDYQALEFQFCNNAFISRFGCRSTFHLGCSRSHHLCNIQAFNLCLNSDEEIYQTKRAVLEKEKSFCIWKYFKATHCGVMCPQPATKYIFRPYFLLVYRFRRYIFIIDIDYRYYRYISRKRNNFFPLKPSATD